MPRQQKITLGEMRAPGVVYCADYKCAHSIAISADRWPDEARLSDLEPPFVCQKCGYRGADVRPDYDWSEAGRCSPFEPWWSGIKPRRPLAFQRSRHRSRSQRQSELVRFEYNAANRTVEIFSDPHNWQMRCHALQRKNIIRGPALRHLTPPCYSL